MQNPEDFEEAREERYEGEAEATDAEKEEAGGEKTLSITNHLFQSDDDAQTMADTLLARLKARKKYFRGTAEFCPVPIEINDTIVAQERIVSAYSNATPYGDEEREYGEEDFPYTSNGVVLAHLGIVRDIKLSVTPNSQSLTFILEE